MQYIKIQSGQNICWKKKNIKNVKKNIFLKTWMIFVVWADDVEHLNLQRMLTMSSSYKVQIVTPACYGSYKAYSKETSNNKWAAHI